MLLQLSQGLSERLAYAPLAGKPEVAHPYSDKVGRQLHVICKLISVKSVYELASERVGKVHSSDRVVKRSVDYIGGFLVPLSDSCRIHPVDPGELPVAFAL